MTEISASVLTVEKDNATTTFYNLETGKVNYFHIDAMDGKFVQKNNLELMKDYALTISHISNLGLDVHLMVEDIENFISDYDKRINEAVLGVDEESEKKTLSFSLTLRGFDVTKLESEIKNIRNLLL